MPEKSSSRGPGLVNFDALTDATTHLIECCILSLTRRLEQDMKRAAEEEGVGDTKSNDVNYKQSRQKENTPKTLRETHQPPRAEVPRKQYKTNTKQTRAQERANAPRESRTNPCQERRRRPYPPLSEVPDVIPPVPRWLHREYDGFEHRQDSGRTKTHPFYNGPLGGPYAHVNNYRQPQRDPWVYHDESQKDRGWGHTVAYSDDARRFDESIGYEPKFEGCECCGGLGLRGGYRSNGSGNSDLPSKPTFNIHHPKGNNVDLNNQQTVPHSEHSGVPIHPSQVAKPSPTDFAVLYDPRTGLPLNPQPETGHTFQDYDGDAEYVPEYQPTPPTPPPFRGLRYSPGPFPLDRQWDHCHQGSTSYGQQHGPRGPLHPRPNPPGPRPSLNNSIASTCSESPSDPSLDSSPHGPTDSQTQHSFLWGMMGAWGTFFMQLVYGQDPTQTHIDIQEARLREGSGEGDSYSEAVFQELDRRGALAANEARLGMRNRGPES